MNYAVRRERKKWTLPHKVLIIGSGGLKIGQAGEFDYSGSQAIKALKEEKIKTILLNPNIATIQTDAGFADRVYFLPLTPHFAREVIAKEKPDAIMLNVGGQTALNVGLALHREGTLKKYGVRVLGTRVAAIEDTEDRARFAARLAEIGVQTPKGKTVRTVEKGLQLSKKLDYPVMVRIGFALGGLGSGAARSQTELKEVLAQALTNGNEALVEEYLGGWKELEYEIMRDAVGNAVTVCNMENMDPMGIHTGESIVIAPSQTLSNEEYHLLRTMALKVAHHLGIIGECNIQFALEPKPPSLSSREAGADDSLRSRSEGRQFSQRGLSEPRRSGASSAARKLRSMSDAPRVRVIEVNARLSRSSALASKATGYPLAFVATKVILGKSLHEIPNAVTKATGSFFEPALDYVAVKIPRWDLSKFRAARHTIGSEMKSVGEVMALGRTFPEALQKAVRMLATNRELFWNNPYATRAAARADIRTPTPTRLWAIAYALHAGVSVREIAQWSFIDPWFLGEMHSISAHARQLRRLGWERYRTDTGLTRLTKQFGFSDFFVAKLYAQSEERVREARIRLRVTPVIKQIDTTAGEFPARTNYLYLTYHGTTHDVKCAKKPVVVLGSGPYRIGSSVEFDWCGVTAVRCLRRMRIPALMVNANPETVSTDYDISDRLYFEELTLERVRDICDFEMPRGIIVSVGGQTPNSLALPLARAGIRILGTTAAQIDRAEDRHKFSSLLDRLHVDQPAWKELTTVADAYAFAAHAGYPVLVRPSYVLSLSAMNVAANDEELTSYLTAATAVSEDSPVVISKFIEGAKEVEIDGIAQKGELILYAITEHVEDAGVHSGDATIVYPPQRLFLETVRRVKLITRGIVKELRITGPFNIQFLVKDNRVQVIECNLRASRSFPFVSKVSRYNFIDVATRAMLGDNIRGDYRTLDLDYVAVKSPQYSFSRIKGADPRPTVEMTSTGEVACFGDSYEEAFLKSILAAGNGIPKKTILLSIGGDTAKGQLLGDIRALAGKGYRLAATNDTADFLGKNGISVNKLHKLSEKKSPNIAEWMQKGTIDCVINIPRRTQSDTALTDGYHIRRLAADCHLTLITDMKLAKLFLRAICNLQEEDLAAKAWDEYITPERWWKHA